MTDTANPLDDLVRSRHVQRALRDQDYVRAEIERTMKPRGQIAASPQAKAAVATLHGKIARDGVASIPGLAPSRRRRRPSLPRVTMERATPTPEQIAKVATEIEVASGTGAHRIRAPMAAAEERFTEDEITAARAFVQEHLTAGAAALQRLTAAPNGMPSTAKGARSGGVADHARPAFSSMMLLYATLDRRAWRLLETVAVGVRREIDGRPWTLEELGRQMTPKPYANADQNRAMTVGALKAVLWQVASHYIRRRALERQTANVRRR
jgi:hypothetical protein